MKKIFSLLMVCLALIPACLFGACSKQEDASAVKNKIYYVTKVYCKGEDISKQYTDANMRIIFYDENFQVEVSNENDSKNYGYYIGTFTTDEMEIYFDVTESGGVYEHYNENPERKVSVFSTLRYSSKKLYAEFAYGGSIYSFTLEQKK